jgi:hypothetical protein
VDDVLFGLAHGLGDLLRRHELSSLELTDRLLEAG